MSPAEGRRLLATLAQAVRTRPRRHLPSPDWADVLLHQVRAIGLPEATRDVRFHPTRRWQLDLAWVDRLVFVECDGGEWSHGRHGRGKGMQDDCIKWNEATLAGWTGFRFTGSQVRNGAALTTLERVFKRRLTA